jgi:hypothetical protein
MYFVVAIFVALVTIATGSANASPVFFSFSGFAADINRLAPPGITNGDLMSGTFSYDPALASIASQNPNGIAYQFSSGAALTIDSLGFSVGSHASPAAPLTVRVGTGGFQIFASAPDPGNNPSNFVPELSLLAGLIAFNPPFSLPVSTFPLSLFMDADAFWNVGSEPAVRFVIRNLAIAAPVAEPGAWLLFALVVTCLLTLRSRWVARISPEGPQAGTTGGMSEA